MLLAEGQWHAGAAARTRILAIHRSARKQPRLDWAIVSRQTQGNPIDDRWRLGEAEPVGGWRRPIEAET